MENLVYVGPIQEGQRYFAKHKKEVGYPIVDNMKGQSYRCGVQRFAPAEGGNFYDTGVLVPRMSDEFAEALGDCVTSANQGQWPRQEDELPTISGADGRGRV